MVFNTLLVYLLNNTYCNLPILTNYLLKTEASSQTAKLLEARCNVAIQPHTESIYCKARSIYKHYANEMFEQRPQVTEKQMLIVFILWPFYLCLLRSMGVVHNRQTLQQAGPFYIPHFIQPFKIKFNSSQK